MRSLLLVLLSVLPGLSTGAFPPAELLEALQARLARPAACHPQCAALQSIELRLGKSQWDMRFEVHAEVATAIPLPAREGQWWPNAVQIPGQPGRQALYRDAKGILWMLAPPGIHTVEVSGPAPLRSQVDLPLPLRPARIGDAFSGRHWAVNGISRDGVPQQQLQLIRRQTVASGKQVKALEPGVLPPLLKVSRTLRFGLDWTVDTRLQRLSPAGSPVTLQLPLIPGEAVTTAGFEVNQGNVEIRLPAGQSQLAFKSRLDPVDRLTLTAPDDVRWSEEWRLDIGPIWHVDYAGLPVIHHQDGRGAWLPTFAPWPGERVDITIARPAAVPGNVLTIDNSRLVVSPGQRATDAVLSFKVRASQGGQHPIALPAGAVLRKVSIDGRTQPVRQDGRAVSLPIRPGEQTFMLEWREERGISRRFESPAIDLGVTSVNHALTVNVGQERWTLLAFGPLLGPAVLFWSVMLVVVLISLALGRSRLAPLKWYHWLLLGVGLTQSGIVGAVIIVGWLLLLGAKERLPTVERPVAYNLIQVVIVLLTLAALSALFDAVSRGLLGFPAMQIEGNGSNAYALNWYQDQVGRVPEQAVIYSAPLVVYRVAMLAWALWLAMALLGWLRWGWSVLSDDTLWRRIDWKLGRRRGDKDSGTQWARPASSRQDTDPVADGNPPPDESR